MRDNAATAQAPAFPGIIDSLGTGFSILNRVIWVLLVPIALDVVLWLSPRVSMTPIVDRWERLSQSTLSQATAAAPPDAASAESMAQTGAAIEAFGSVFREFDLLSLLTMSVPISSVPSLGGLAKMDPSSVISVDRISMLFLLAVALQIVGLLLACLYLVMIAQGVTGERVSPVAIARRVGRAWLNAMACALLLLAIALAVIGPLSVLLAILAAVAPALAGQLFVLIFIAGWVASVWMLLYLYFVTSAIVVGRLGPVKSILASIRIVRTHFWPSLGLVFLTLMIMLGMSRIWTQLFSQPWGFAIASLGNSYIATGLITAGLYFYWHRSGLAGRTSRPSGSAV